MESEFQIADMANLPTEIPDLEQLMRERGMDPQNLADFNDKAAHVNDIVQKLLSGEITPEQAEAEQIKLNLKDKVREMRIREKVEKQIEAKRMGRSGKGETSNYTWVCRSCAVEYENDFEIKAPIQFSPAVFPRNDKAAGTEELPADVEPLSVAPPKIDSIPAPERCTNRACCRRCGKQMMTRDERHQELRTLVEDSRVERLRRKERRARWETYRKEQQIKIKSSSSGPTVYDKWRFWEPSEDEDEQLGPVLPKDNPEFRALEKELDESMRKRVDRRKAAIKMKELGNSCLKQGDFATAIRHYTDGLEKAKDMVQLWTNKALAEVKLSRFDDAVKSCGHVIELAEIFDGGLERNAESNFKALTRRAMAYRGLSKWREAVDDLEKALQLMPNERETQKMLVLTKEALCHQVESHPSSNEAAVEKNLKIESKDEGKGLKIEDVTEEEESKAALRKQEDLRKHQEALNAASEMLASDGEKDSSSTALSVSKTISDADIIRIIEAITALETETRTHARSLVEKRNQIWPSGNVNDSKVLSAVGCAWREALTKVETTLKGCLVGLHTLALILKDVPDKISEQQTKHEAHLLHLVDFLNIKSFARTLTRFSGFLWGAVSSSNQSQFAEENFNGELTTQLRLSFLEILLRMLECDVTRDSVFSALDVSSPFCRLLVDLFCVSTRAVCDAQDVQASCLRTTSPVLKFFSAELAAALLVNLTVQPRGRKALRLAFPPSSDTPFHSNIVPRITLVASSALCLGLTKSDGWRSKIDPRSHLGGLAASLLAHMAMDDEMRTTVSRLCLPKAFAALQALTKWALGLDSDNDITAALMVADTAKDFSHAVPSNQLKNAVERTRQLLALLHNISVAVSSASNSALPDSVRKAGMQTTQYLLDALSKSEGNAASTSSHPLMTLTLFVFSPRDESVRSRAAGVLVRLMGVCFQAKQNIPHAVLEATELLMRSVFLFNSSSSVSANSNSVEGSDRAIRTSSLSKLGFNSNISIKDACVRLLNLFISHRDYLNKLVVSPSMPFSEEASQITPTEKISLVCVRALAAEALGFDPRYILSAAGGEKQTNETELLSLLLMAANPVTSRKEEENKEVNSSDLFPSWSLAILASRLCEILKEAAPKNYVQAVNNTASGREGLTSLVGNVSSVMQQVLAFVDTHGGVNSKLKAVQEVNVRTAIVPLIETVRKETGVAQKNAVTALARLARDERYSETVRNLGGIESLTQIGSRLLSK